MNRQKNWYKYGLMMLICVIAISQSSCKKDFNGYYDYPEGLEGPIYQQLSADTSFSEFVRAIDRLPQFKHAINTSGLYTAFIPTNQAVKEYLRSKYSKSSFDEFDMKNPGDSIIIQRFVDAHFVMDMYFEYNFNKNVRDETFYNDRYRYYTRYKDPTYDYYDKRFRVWRKVITGNKMLSVYMGKYLTKHGITSDYEKLFDGVPGTFNVEGAQILPDKKDIAAINGVIHGINKVLEPRLNVNQLLEQENRLLADMFDNLTYLSFDETASREAAKGEKMDSLFNRIVLGSDYYNLTDENSMRTIFCPPVDEYNNYIRNTVLPGFENHIDSIPRITKAYLSISYLAEDAKWSTNLETGVIVETGDTLVKPNIRNTMLASNGIIYMMNDLKLSAAFRTVAKGALLNKNYRWFLDFLLQSGGTSGGQDNIRYLSNLGKEYTVFVPCNDAIRNVDGYDIVREPYTSTIDLYISASYRRKGRRMTARQMDSLVNYTIIPDVIIDPDHMPANKWYETRLGNYIQVKDKKLDGTIPLPRYERTENGIIYYLDSKDMPVKPGSSIAAIIKARYPNYYKIIKTFKVDQEKGDDYPDDLTLESLLKLNSEDFTVFVPSDAALDAFKQANGYDDYDKDKRWGQVAKYLMTRTRVYSDGTYKQDQAAMNPDPDDPSKFVSIFKDLVHVNDPAGVDNYSSFKLSYSGGMTITGKTGDVARVKTITYNGRNLEDIEATNGVIHEIDAVLMLPAQVQE